MRKPQTKEFNLKKNGTSVCHKCQCPLIVINPFPLWYKMFVVCFMNKMFESGEQGAYLKDNDACK